MKKKKKAKKEEEKELKKKKDKKKKLKNDKSKSSKGKNKKTHTKTLVNVKKEKKKEFKKESKNSPPIKIVHQKGPSSNQTARQAIARIRAYKTIQGVLSYVQGETRITVLKAVEIRKRQLDKKTSS